jgi:hypothetical protein
MTPRNKLVTVKEGVGKEEIIACCTSIGWSAWW